MTNQTEREQLIAEANYLTSNAPLGRSVWLEPDKSILIIRRLVAALSESQPPVASEDEFMGAAASCHLCVGAGGYEGFDGEWVECSCQIPTPTQTVDADPRERALKAARESGWYARFDRFGNEYANLYWLDAEGSFHVGTKSGSIVRAEAVAEERLVRMIVDGIALATAQPTEGERDGQ